MHADTSRLIPHSQQIKRNRHTHRLLSVQSRSLVPRLSRTEKPRNEARLSRTEKPGNEAWLSSTGKSGNEASETVDTASTSPSNLIGLVSCKCEL